MIIRLEENDKYLTDLEVLFKDVFIKDKVNKDINNNIFTNYLVYIKDNKVIAFINYYVMYERAELININVSKEYENNHIATKLLEYMINDCIEKEVNSISLEVKETNINAIHLYSKFGFKKVGIRKGYYQGIDGILMEKELM